jgi:hypothetical protein
MNDHFAIRPAHARESVRTGQLLVIVNLAVANELAAQQTKRLVAAGGESVDGEAVEPHAAMAVHAEPAVVGTTVRDFSKIGLQHIQRVHGDAILGATATADRLIIEDAAHLTNKQKPNETNNNDKQCDKLFK